MWKEATTRAGLGVYVIKDGKFLMGERIGSHGANTYCPPGGHLELGETWEECAKREVLEETGLEVTNLRFLGVTNDIYKEDGKHHVTIAMLADYISGEPKIMEPHKCKEWIWVDLDTLPENLFMPIQNLIQGQFREVLEKELIKSKK